MKCTLSLVCIEFIVDKLLEIDREREKERGRESVRERKRERERERRENRRYFFIVPLCIREVKFAMDWRAIISLIPGSYGVSGVEQKHA